MAGPSASLCAIAHGVRRTQKEPLRIPLRARDGTVRAYALIDQEDAYLAEYRWHVGNGGYALRRVGGRGQQQTIMMHRLILGLERSDRREPDHINGDRLDNRRTNLRILPKGANPQNLQPRTGASSQYRGVSFNKQTGRWTAACKLHGKRTFLGYFATELEAAVAASEWRAENVPYANEARTGLPGLRLVRQAEVTPEDVAA